MLKIKKGDQVVVITGKDKGKKGLVSRVINNKERESHKVVIVGVNKAVRHVKPSRANPQGGLVQKEMPIDVSNVMHIDPKTDLPTKVGFKTLENGKKVRFAKKSGEIIDNI